MKVIDTFPFNGDWIVKLRLEWLSPFVDEFVIVESRYTFSGVRKDFLFKDKWEETFRPYASKIHWIIVEDLPVMTEEWYSLYKQQPWFKEEYKNAWFHEHCQRDAVVSYIQEKYKDEQYIVHVGDVDEVPKPDIFYAETREGMLTKLKELRQPLYLEMLFFYYNFYWKKPQNWYRSYIIGKEQLEVEKSLNYWRLCFLPNFVLRDAGWHFSYFMEISDIQRKVQSFSHQEFNKDQWTNTNHIKECIAQGKDIFERGGSEQLVHDENISFPDLFSSYRGEIDYLQMS